MILDNLNKIRYRIRAAAGRAGRNPDKIGLVAVTKYASLESVKELLGSGLVHEIGESRAQEARFKKEALGLLAPKVSWRLIGHLQTNKAKQALEVFDAIDSLDSVRLAEALEKNLSAGNRRLPALIQIKLSQKESQSGIAPEAMPSFLENLKACPHIKINGLMAIAPMESPERLRPQFRLMRGLFDHFFSGRPESQLSMGMSRDFEIAVEEGATLVRIGSGIFS